MLAPPSDPDCLDSDPDCPDSDLDFLDSDPDFPDSDPDFSRFSGVKYPKFVRTHLKLEVVV